MLVSTLLSFVALASAHGVVQKPVVRQAGPATSAACGQLLADFFKADNTSSYQAFQNAHPDFEPAPGCAPSLCRGYQLADNTANVYSYKAGDKVDFEVLITVPANGVANVSIIETKSNTPIHQPLLSWPVAYADSTLFPNLPKNETQFSVTIPDLSGYCARAGDCVIQWYWFGRGYIYEDCVDFTFEEPATMRRGARIVV